MNKINTMKALKQNRKYYLNNSYYYEDKHKNNNKFIKQSKSQINSERELKNAKYELQKNYNQLDNNNDFYSKYRNEIITITELWDKLGTNELYKTVFEKLIIEVGEETMVKEIYNNELKLLQSLDDHLTNLTSEIKHREDLIDNLKHIVDYLDKKNEFSEEVLTAVINYVKNIRIHSVNIIHYFKSIQEEASYKIAKGKFNFDHLSKKYYYDKNYLNKVI